MSAASFDDSSNLVDIPVPENNGHTDSASESSKAQQLDIPNDSDDLHDVKEHDTKSRSKKSRAKKLFKRAKSPISGAINKTTKEFKKLSNLPKHHYTSSPKSPCKSPSKENLTEEYSHLEDKLGEKKSEEWQAFLQMQDRIKQTVLKTQTSLNKYNSQSEDDEQKPGKTGWTDFEADTGLEPEELIDTSFAPSINISCVNTISELNDQNFSDLIRDRSHLEITSQPSPPISPGPPVNSRISSMENLLQDQPKEKVADAKVEEECDLLGLLGDEAPSASGNISKSSDLFTQDLLGLDDFLGPAPAGTETTDTDGVQVLSGYTFTASTSGDMVTSVSKPEPKSHIADDLFFDNTDEKETTLGTTNQNVTSDILGENTDNHEDSLNHPESQTSKPIKNILAPMLGDPLAPISIKPQKNVGNSQLQTDEKSTDVPKKTVFDDFDSFDPMKADFPDVGHSSSASVYNPFRGTSSPITIISDNQTNTSNVNMFGSSPQSYGSSPMGSSNIDLLSKIKMMSSKSQSASPVRRKAPKPPTTDHFGFVKKELKKPNEEDDDGSYKAIADLGKPKFEPQAQKSDEELKPTNDTASESGAAIAANNPFLSGSFDDTAMASGQVITENAAAMFGLDEDTKLADTDFGGNAWEADLGESRRQQWTNVDELDASDNAFGETFDFEKTAGSSAFDQDSVWKTEASEQKTVDAWGSEADVETESSNPFQDDFSKLDEVAMEEVASANANPFLSEDITDSSTAGASSMVNPFLDFGIQPVASEQSNELLGSQPVVLSDSESFFMDSVSDTQQDTGVSDDIFDPFKVTSKEADSAAPDALDLFSSAAAAGDKQLAKPSDSDDLGFKLEIKPASEVNLTDSTSPAPILKPPPKPPKSPQPPRLNPFDRDSPPEEDFAQFEIKDVEKPKEPPPKSISTDSTTTEEEEILEPLEPYLPKSEKEGFKLMLRYPTKKKIAGNRYWKNVYVKLVKQSDGPVIKVYNDANDAMPLQELPLQPCYSLSETELQQYDQYGKIHTTKLQYVFYKERVGIKTERITPSIVKFKKREKPKATMILDHSPQVSELLKFGSLDKAEIIEFIQEVEDTFMNLEVHREKTLTYAKDEVTAEVHDEYMAELNKFGRVLSQKARVRIFVLCFLTGMPTVEIGLNDKRRRGKEVVGRNDIIPIKTEEWIKLEDVEFHCCVDKADFEKTNNIKFHPLDACQFELLRYRVRPRENKELPLQLTIQQIFKNRKCEIRCDLLVTGYHSYSKKHGQFPCEDIEVRFPIPEQWIYMFRYERRFGYGSIHSTTRKPGKIKGLERLTMMAQGHFNQTLMEADVGTAKYEHVYRCVVWRIPRLPVRNQGAYTSHLMKLRLELGPHDEVPDSYENYANVEFSMPCSTVSQSQIRSIAVTNPNPPEKWVRSMAHYQYRIEIEHLDEYPEMMAIGTVYKEATMTTSPTKSEEENTEPEERDPRLAVSDTDSSDSD